MKLVFYGVGLNCPLQAREQLSITSRQQCEMLQAMHAEAAISEAVVLNTCNRLEFYIYAAKGFDVSGFLSDLIGRFRNDCAGIWQKYNQQITGIDVVRHLFSVAAGLDSQMLGESQVLSQLKAAYTLSCECKTSRFLFHRLFHNAFRVGKAVRTRTKISCGAVSVGLAAVELAKSKITLPGSAAMIIGAGENAALTARALIKAGIAELIVANRNTEIAEKLISKSARGRAIKLNAISSHLKNVDVVISSTAAAKYIVKYDDAAEALARREKPLLIIDIAVPRDIDPALGEIDNVSLYNIEDLNDQIGRNKVKRTAETPKARAIVTEYTDKFAQWLDSLNLVPTISRLNRQLTELAKAEAKRYAGDFDKIECEKLELFAESLAQKILHGPISYLKNCDVEEPSVEQLQAAELINKMFFLHKQDGKGR